MTTKKLLPLTVLASYLLFSLISCSALAQTDAIVNVKKFGAKGNGTTDDTKAIQASFAQVLQKGGTVYFPEGTYLTNIIDIKPQKGVSVSVSGEAGRTKIIKNPQDPMNVALFFCEVAGANLSFKNLSLDGSSSSKIGKWKTIAGKNIDIDAGVNAIFVWNAASLTVTSCEIKNFHGKGIACFSSGRLIANDNVISNVSGSGINGHRVDSMQTNNNKITGAGYIGDKFILDGKQHDRSSYYPPIKFGDGIESESKFFSATGNIIVNASRCGIVHDLAKDLGYRNSHAIVSNNSVEVNSDNVNNNNPPAGMWFEQSAIVEVTHNKIFFRKSWSKLVSGIRFYDITSSITCTNNMVDGKGYNHITDDGIGVYEPAIDNVNVSKNTISGNFTASVVISYGLADSKIDNLTIADNQFSGGDANKANTGIQISIDGKKQFPPSANIINNRMISGIDKPYNFFYYGAQSSGKPITATLKLSNNTVNGISQNKLPKTPAGIKIVN